MYGDFAVFKDGVWHNAQPMVLKRLEPFCADAMNGTGAGGADSRMNVAKFVTSLEPPAMGVESSGVTLNTQPGTAERSFMKTTFATPCSTL